MAIESIRSLLRTRWSTAESLCVNVATLLANLFKTPVTGISLVKSGTSYGARFQNGKMIKGKSCSILGNTAGLLCRKYTPSIYYGELYEQFPFLFSKKNAELKSLICMPLIGNNCGMLGVIYAAGSEKRQFDKTDISIMDVLGWHIAVALERIAVSGSSSPVSEDLTVFSGFFSGLAHEVRNPLNAISALSAALLNDLGDSSEYRRFISLIMEQTERISGLIQQLMMLGEPANMTKSSLKTLVDISHNVIERWPERNCTEKLNLRFIENESVNGSFMANSGHIEFAITELIRNALQNSPAGSEIIVDVGEYNDNYYVKVIDRGSGIPEEIKNRIFEPFFTTHKKKNGLGLSLIKRITETHGGKVALYNNKYFEGCTAEIQFPVTPYVS